MDANGTLFQLLLGRDDWASCLDQRQRPLGESWDESSDNAALNASGTDWDERRDELTLQPRLFQFGATPRDARPLLKDRRGAARDLYGNWYWIDATRREILVSSSGTQATTHFWSSTDSIKCRASEAADGAFHATVDAPSQTLLELSGMAVTEDHYLVVGVQEPAGLLLFDLHAGGSPRQLLWPAGVRFAPFDMVAAPGGGLFVLDRENRRYWILDRHFNVIGPERAEASQASAPPDDFQPADTGPARHTAVWSGSLKAITDDAACQLHFDEAVAIEALPDGTVLILEGDPEADEAEGERFSLVHRYRFDVELGQKPASTSSMLTCIEGTGDDFSLIGYDFAFVPDGATREEGLLGHLYVAEKNGNQAYAFDLKLHGDQLSLKALADYLPMRLFGGKAIVGTSKGVYYDFEERWIPLVKQPRPRYEVEATIFTPLADEDEEIATGDGRPRGAFDGREPDCVWHRLMLDACIPPEAEVLVWSRAANDQRELALAEWQPEPRPYLRGNGSELPFAVQASRESKGTGTWELLFQNARGRFLQLQIKLVGNGRTTARLRALRAYYPRFSYLNHYLPSVYREDPESASFLDRFLANLEGTFTSLEDRIAAAQMLFDTRAAPPEALDWLASWFGIALDPAWDDARRRLFIKHAMDFFNRRGTLNGLRLALQLVIDACADETIFAESSARGPTRESGIRIVEKFRMRRAPGAVFGDPTDYEGVPAGLRSTRWLTATASGANLVQSGAQANVEAGFENLPGVPPCREQAKPSTVGASAAADSLRPEDGAAAIAQERTRWQDFLKSRYAQIDEFNRAYAPFGAQPRGAFAEIPLPADLPPNGAPLDDWLAWLSLSSESSATRDRKLWQDFLARRYRLTAALNRAYETHWTSFETVSLPDAAPRRNVALQDWELFAGVVLAMHRTAHRFTVLLPIAPAHRDDALALEERRSLAERIIRLEKPAHTSFEVKFYWAAFRLGEARLGADTLVDRGSRAPQWIQPLILNRTYIAEGYLASSNPPDLFDRQIIGRTRLG
ncbi:MAG TPA: phage tail protein [Pyrinomonadaceae bacterium]|jgi:phage tail-like protein